MLTLIETDELPQILSLDAVRTTAGAVLLTVMVVVAMVVQLLSVAVARTVDVLVMPANS